MKNLELTQMEEVSGESSWITGFACGFTIAASVGVILGTAGAGAVLAAYATGAACGGLVGYGLASGDWF